jgi:hypothetical protein
MVELRDANTGALRATPSVSPFQPPVFRDIQAQVVPGTGTDGTAEVLVTGRKGRRIETVAIIAILVG